MKCNPCLNKYYTIENGKLVELQKRKVWDVSSLYPTQIRKGIK